jgi:hypothetical protein
MSRGPQRRWGSCHYCDAPRLGFVMIEMGVDYWEVVLVLALVRWVGVDVLACEVGRCCMNLASGTRQHEHQRRQVQREATLTHNDTCFALVTGKNTCLARAVPDSNTPDLKIIQRNTVCRNAATAALECIFYGLRAEISPGRGRVEKAHVRGNISLRTKFALAQKFQQFLSGVCWARRRVAAQVRNELMPSPSSRACAIGLSISDTWSNASSDASAE